MPAAMASMGLAQYESGKVAYQLDRYLKVRPPAQCQPVKTIVAWRQHEAWGILLPCPESKRLMPGFGGGGVRSHLGAEPWTAALHEGSCFSANPFDVVYRDLLP